MPLFFYSRLLAFNHTENADILTMIQSFLCIFFSFNLKIFLVFCVFNLTFYNQFKELVKNAVVDRTKRKELER